MNCISEQLLQKFVDGECTENEKSELEQHFAKCTECTQRITERKKLSEEIKQEINLLTTENIEIPVFKLKETDSGKRLKIFIYSLSAASIILFVLFFAEKKIESKSNRITILQSIPLEIDANRPASEQDFVIQVFDGYGGRTECLIE